VSAPLAWAETNLKVSLATEVADAIKVVKGAAARRKAAKQPQRDLEEATGVAPAQAQREAEAGGIAADRLRSIVERVERLEEERSALARDVKDIFTEAKSAGFDAKVLRMILRLRRKDAAAREEEQTLLDLYCRALGM
jgi:uncharacterized protein (UPF0335 family)